MIKMYTYIIVQVYNCTQHVQRMYKGMYNYINTYYSYFKYSYYEIRMFKNKFLNGLKH